MIPCTHHQVWTSDNAFAPKFHAWRLSWLKLNPHWSSKLWRIEDMPMSCFPPICRDMMLSPALHYVLKSDIARFLVTWLEGGVYSDCDVDCWKPMEQFLDNEAFCGQSVTEGIASNGVIGCIPRYPLFLKIATQMSEKIAGNIDDANKTIVDYGVNFAGEMLLDCDKIYPADYFSPMTPGFRMHHKDHAIKPEDYPGSYCFHYWTGTDADGWYTNTIGNGEPVHQTTEEEWNRSVIFYGKNARKEDQK